MRTRILGYSYRHTLIPFRVFVFALYKNYLRRLHTRKRVVADYWVTRAQNRNLILSAQHPATAVNSSDACDTSCIAPSRSLSAQQPVIAVESSDARSTITSLDSLFPPRCVEKRDTASSTAVRQDRDVVQPIIVQQQDPDVITILMKYIRGSAHRCLEKSPSASLWRLDGFVFPEL